MANRNSNNYKVCIVPESSYGVINKTLTTVGGAVFFDNIFEWNYAPITVERASKENTLYKAAERTAITGKLVTGTLSGDLTDAHEILLQTHFDDASSPYLYASALPATKSVNIYQLYLDSTGACTHYDVILGAIINPLTITGEANGIIQFSASIEGASYLQEQANSAGTVLTLESGLPVDGVPFLFGNVTCLNLSSLTSLLSFSLELRKTMVDNAQRFKNSLTKTSDAYSQVGGTLTTSSMFDTSNDGGWKDAMYNSTAYRATITLVNSVQTWAIETNGIITDCTRPDADRGDFIQNLTCDLSTSTALGEVPVTITVTNL